MYQTAVRTASGDRPDWQDDIPDEAFLAYIERSSPNIPDNALRKEATSGAFSYEKWIGGGNQRRMAGDFGLAS